METARLKAFGVYGLLLVVVIFLALFEYVGLTANRGALLVVLVFWTGLAQGCIAVVAITDLTNARWAGLWKRELLAIHPLLVLSILLFLLALFRLDLYPWTHETTAWLNPGFFVGRNLAALVAVYIAARRFIRSTLAEAGTKKRDAVIYLFLFVISQTLVAYDWVMSLAYPWISTLFGPFFFVEATYAGLGLSGFVAFFTYRKKLAAHPDRAPALLKDLATLMFGFSILWGGLFFAQFLLIWYGNLPEEVHYIYQRVNGFPFAQMSVGYLMMVFGVPFVVLLSRHTKRSPGVIGAVGMVMLAGLFIERLLMIWPETTLHPGLAAMQTVLVGGFWLLTIHLRDEILPGEKSGKTDGG